jgi:UDP-N-acetylmuramoyl-L-alanyl-D-glutamate--2,6-diaminopimelate ligase
MKPDGIEYELVSDCSIIRMRLKMGGKFSVYNSLCAAACAKSLGFSDDEIASALESLSGVKGRAEVVPTGRDFTVIIDYAHTPDAIEKLLHSVRAMIPKGSRIILLFGCGGDRDKSKRKIMGQIASRLADFVVLTSDNPRSESPREIIKDVLKGLDKEKEFAVIESRREAILDAIVRYARSKDTVVLAGKGHELYEINVSGKHPFDERKIARDALAKRRRMRQERM